MSPDSEQFIFAPTDDPLTVRTPVDRVDLISMTRKVIDQLPGLHRPQFERGVR